MDDSRFNENRAFQPSMYKIKDHNMATKPLLNILIKDKTGKIVDLASLNGKVVFINFLGYLLPAMYRRNAVN